MRPDVAPIDRRGALGLTIGAALVCAPALAAATVDPALAAIEARIGGRLGFMALDTATGRQMTHRANERFATASTFKWLLAAAVLSRVDHGVDQLDRWVPYTKADLLAVSPRTTADLAKGGMSVEDLCAAIVEVSDNTAANLLLAGLGGPAGLTKWLRQIGDTVTRMDRNEPTLNSAVAGDPRDTTSPAAMVRNLNRLLVGPGLQPMMGERLIGWMEASTTGLTLLRAGLPKDWRVADKTGRGGNATTNDVCLAWPPSGAPILIAAYTTAGKAAEAQREAAMAELGRLVGTRFA